MVALAKFDGRAGLICPALSTLAELTGYDVRTVRRLLRSLEAAGCVRSVRRKDEGAALSLTSRYWLTLPGIDRPKKTAAPPPQPSAANGEAGARP